MFLLIWIISGVIAGWLAGLAIQGHGLGVLMDLVVGLVVGLVGGLIGGFLAGLFGLQPTSWVGGILVAALGGVVLVWILHLIHPGIA